MGFFRRLFGGERDADDTPDDVAEASEAAQPAPAEPDEAERAHELEMARFEQDRTDDLIRRQQRYADRSWTPPAQGGERRSDDEDAPKG
jgi:ABC-type nitrate/sulfonate/bicarbonate transport system substrate-binding protein